MRWFNIGLFDRIRAAAKAIKEIFIPPKPIITPPPIPSPPPPPPERFLVEFIIHLRDSDRKRAAQDYVEFIGKDVFDHIPLQEELFAYAKERTDRDAAAEGIDITFEAYKLKSIKTEKL